MKGILHHRCIFSKPYHKLLLLMNQTYIYLSNPFLPYLKPQLTSKSAVTRIRIFFHFQKKKTTKIIVKLHSLFWSQEDPLVF